MYIHFLFVTFVTHDTWVYQKIMCNICYTFVPVMNIPMHILHINTPMHLYL